MVNFALLLRSLQLRSVDPIPGGPLGLVLDPIHGDPLGLGLDSQLMRVLQNARKRYGDAGYSNIYRAVYDRVFWPSWDYREAVQTNLRGRRR